MRTIIWFIYFWGYLLFSWPMLHKGLAAQKRGDNAVGDALAAKYVPHWAGRLLAMAGVTVTVTGRENIPAGRPCVFVANHRSYYDIPLMLTQLDAPHALVSKIEVSRIPLVRGWMRLLHCVFVDRGDARQSIQCLSQATENVRAGYSVTIFPEGTRYKGAEGGLGEFKGGAFRIATKTGAPVVPVAISHSRDVMENNHMLMHPAKVTVRILPAIQVAELDKETQKALPELVQEQIRLALPEHTPAPENAENPYHRLYTQNNSFAQLARSRNAAEK